MCGGGGGGGRELCGENGLSRNSYHWGIVVDILKIVLKSSGVIQMCQEGQVIRPSDPQFKNMT